MSTITEAGEVIHLAKSGRLILKITKDIKLAAGEILTDESGKKVGRVTELIGPVIAPYASILLLDNRTKTTAGSKLFRFSFQRSQLYKTRRNSRPIKKKKLKFNR
jgi:RNA-binding protein